MAKYASMVKEVTTSTGTGTINLGGAVSGFRGFLAPANISDQDYVPYFLLDANGAWEEGYGQVIAGAPDQLSRAFVMDSSAGGAAITLSAGTHTVGIGPIAAIRRRHGALVERATNQSISSGVHTKIQFDSITYDDDNFFSSIPDFIIPLWANKIMLSANVRVTTNSSGDRQFYFRKNGSTGTPGASRLGTRAPSGDRFYGSISSPEIDVVGGDLMSAWVFQNSGSTLVIENDPTYMSISVIE